MANENFSDTLQKLKEIHDKEVLGMQTKLTELTMERCRDGQRLEELFSKNHIMREQHKVLNENIKVLENRLRAGLCDRCTVTQELAKKKQQEYENYHFHNMQQISSLTNQINMLKEENKSLLEELRKLKHLDVKNRSRSHSPENNATSEPPHSELPKNNPEPSRTQTSADGEAREMFSDHSASEETSPAVLTLSPVLKSIQMMSNETRQADLTMSGVQKVLLTNHNQQRISNQLHGTIAVLRPGAKCGQSGTLSPNHRQSSTNDAHPKESPTDLPEPPSPLDSLKHVIPEEQLNLLRQHFVQTRLAQRSQGVPSDGPVRYVLAKNREPVLERKRSEEDLEEKAAMEELQGAMLYVREQRYKNRMIQTNQRDKIHYVIAKPNQGLRSPTSPKDVPKYLTREGEKELSLIQVLSTHWKNNRRLESPEEEKDWSQKEVRRAETEKRGRFEEDVTPDKPLDLSDTRRGHHSAQNDIKKEPKGHYETHMANLASRNIDSPPNRASVSDHVYRIRTEDSMVVAKSERERDTEEDVMEHNVGTDIPILKRPGKGNKRHRELEADDEKEGQGTEGNSPPQDDDDLDTSDSEGEVEKSQHSGEREASRDRYGGERNHSRWKKRLSQASKKCLKKKKSVNHPAESDISQDEHELETPA